jgi:hypothetical protein
MYDDDNGNDHCIDDKGWALFHGKNDLSLFFSIIL